MFHILKSVFLKILFLIAASPFISTAQKTEDVTEKKWTGNLEADYYFLPEYKLHPTIIGYAENKALHFEARYNYEDNNTASVNIGRTWSKDGDFSFSITPMAGVAFGKSDGVLPGYECEATYSKIYFYSEGEYLLDFKGKGNYFFYSWTQLGANIFKNLQAGAITESLRWYQTKLAVQKGVYAEYATGRFLFDFYYFNPFSKYTYVVCSVSFEF